MPVAEHFPSRIHALFYVITLLLVAGCSSGPDTTDSLPNYDLLGACERPEDGRYAYLFENAYCGTIQVNEDRTREDGRKIDLNVMILPASGAVRRSDPVFYLAGGPGQAATDGGPAIASRLSGIARERDLVMVDQRGTGKSNSLACEMEDSIVDSIGTSLDELNRLQLESMRDCLSKYDADPSLYTTPIAMDDLNEVREKLGYDKINLIGISYGTRAGLVYLRRHGDTVRTAILDGLAPLTMAIPANVAIDTQTAWQAVLDDCAANDACTDAYPDIATMLPDLLAKLQTPVTTNIIHPRTGEMTEAQIEARLVTRLIRSVLYSRDLASMLPLAISEAHKGNYQTLVALGHAFAGDDVKMSLGMMSSVLCAEDMKRGVPVGLDETFDNPIHETLIPICEFWPKGDIPDEYFEPVSSDVPVLLFSGTLDPITPPKYGFDAAATLSNSQHIVVPGIGHNTIFSGCVPELLEEFLQDMDAPGLQAGCVTDISRPHFFTNHAGPARLSHDKD